MREMVSLDESAILLELRMTLAALRYSVMLSIALVLSTNILEIWKELKIFLKKVFLG